MFFQDLCKFVRHCNKIFFFVYLLFLLTIITSRNEAIIVELTESGGYYHYISRKYEK